MISRYAPPRVLIVDDDPVVATVTAALLEDRGYTVELRTTPFGTGAYVQQSRPDIVLLDIQMPGLSGDHIAQMIKQAPGGSTTHVILFSYRSTEELTKLARKCGAIAAIRKGIAEEEFLQEFERASQTMRYLAL